ncbi:carbohydrate sulfotransferase 1-like [Saccoglossus kowalevskii]|uniref:Carbohydrate sulfotransferase 1-like n=1 Tax=Saccoglossus kowalevskii TaxID=10224 RepID=A0ABM0M4I4_SACKO|nr:PREDICTED: carbohydrate sulfotransferase 1-like [Saccoglossus kowalevskii]
MVPVKRLVAVVVMALVIANVLLMTSWRDNVNNYYRSSIKLREDANIPTTSATAPGPIRVLIHARMRTGSSSTARYISSRPDFQYLYEPGLIFRHSQQYTFNAYDDSFSQLSPLQPELSEVIEGFFQCNYSHSPLLVYFLNRAPWVTTQMNISNLGVKNKTITPEKLTSYCKTKRHSIVKTIRITNILEAMSLLQRYNVKVIILVRDPRGMISSRERFQVWRFSNEWSRKVNLPKFKHAVQNHCQWLDANIQAVLYGPEWFKASYIVVRYEDLTDRPFELVPKLYDFIGLDAKDISAEMYNVTKIGNGMAWRHVLPWERTLTAQSSCPGNVFDVFGYVKAKSEHELRDESFLLMRNVSELSDKIRFLK